MTEMQKLSEELFSTLFQMRNHKLSPKPFPNPHEGVRPGEMMLMVQLWENQCKTGRVGQGMTISELSAAFGTSSSSITQHVNPLEKAGYLTRSSDPADRRVVRVQLTEKGQTQMEEVRRQIFGEVNQLAAFLGPEDTAAFTRLLKRVWEFKQAYDQKHTKGR